MKALKIFPSDFPVFSFRVALVCLAVSGGLFSCQKEHSEYRYKPKYHAGDKVQFEKSIEHDNAQPGKKMWDIPQPMTIDAFYYNATWRDNWYIVTYADGTKGDNVGIDELSLQKWNGKLQK